LLPSGLHSLWLVPEYHYCQADSREQLNNSEPRSQFNYRHGTT